MRALMAAATSLAAVALFACGDDGKGHGGDDTVDACVGLGCMQVTCPTGTTTSISGTVYAPNGTLPLYNVTVYVPNGTVEALPPGATCDRCGEPPTGDPLVLTYSDEAGHFELDNVPATDNVPIVFQVGKWRRQITIPHIASCEDTPLTVDQARLPKNQSEGDIPQMALTTGGADALECLLRKIGLDDSEFTPAGGPGKVHLFAGTGGSNKFNASHGGMNMANAQTLWDTKAHLMPYDVTFFSCEGGQNPGTKPDTARQAVSDYTDAGGRVFASHWHNIWIEGAPDASLWRTTETPNHLADLGNIRADINTGFPRGNSLATWLNNVGGSPAGMLGKIDITDTQHTVQAVNPATTEKWIYKDVTANNVPSVQYFQFTTPLTVEPTQRCGKVVFSDIHVSTGDDSATTIAFPDGCTTTGLTPQEKVLAFMIFDIASCVGPPIGREVPPIARLPETFRSPAGGGPTE